MLHRQLGRVRTALILACLSLCFGCATHYDAGPLASRRTDVFGITRHRAAGPIWEKASATNGLSLDAVRPLYSHLDSVTNDKAASDYLWPVGTVRRTHDESQWRFLVFMGFNHGADKQAKPRYRFWLFPFYFQGRDAKGVEYRAVFPLAGRINEFLGRDEFTFVLFPIRSTSSLNDLRTSNWIWPLISRTTGDDTERFRVFPFYGVSRRAGEYEKKFILWPFWNSVRYDYEKSPGGGFVLFPLVGHVTAGAHETWWVLPPFFRFARGPKMDLTYAPWPFVQVIDSLDMEKFYLWPLWGHARVGNTERTFAPWPIIWSIHVERGDTTLHRQMAIPFVYHEKEVLNRGPQEGEHLVKSRYFKLWPLGSYRRIEENSRIKLLDLWPLAETPAVERNWAPFWTLYDRRANGRDRDTELLWGLYRSERRGTTGRYVSLFPLFDYDRQDAAGRREWNILKGLIGYERDHSQRRIRVLYFLTF